MKGASSRALIPEEAAPAPLGTRPCSGTLRAEFGGGGGEHCVRTFVTAGAAERDCCRWLRGDGRRRICLQNNRVHLHPERRDSLILQAPKDGSEDSWLLCVKRMSSAVSPTHSAAPVQLPGLERLKRRKFRRSSFTCFVGLFAELLNSKASGELVTEPGAGIPMSSIHQLNKQQRAEGPAPAAPPARTAPAAELTYLTIPNTQR